MKRLLDTIIVIVAMPFWLCAAAACAVAILLTLGRPVLFRQERAGKNGKSFSIAKFRTMREGDGSDAERLTKIGRIIRATSLDELPQLFQVLSGKMALVGPRPLPVRTTMLTGRSVRSCRAVRARRSA